MKTTIDIPTDVYRRVKAKSALLGKRVRDVTIELYKNWLAEGMPASPKQSPEEWVEEWIRLGEETLRKAPPVPRRQRSWRLIGDGWDRAEPC